MKTIKEAAEERSKKFWGIRDVEAWNTNELREFCENDFEAGAEFAQRWIPATTELPEENFNEFGMQFGIDLLVKCPNNKIYLVDRKWSDDHNNFIWRYKDGSRVYEVTHWRPIELT